MPSPVITVIIVTHNSAGWLPGFFKTWRTAVPSLPVEIVIADSGSTDNTRALTATLAPEAHILDCGNIGYGAAANRAAASATGPAPTPWLLLCNPDLHFPSDFQSTFLHPMITSSPEGAGCIAPDLCNADTSGQHSVGNFPTIRGILRDQFRPRLERKYVTRSRAHFFDWATGACLLLRRDHFNAVGGFDEMFFLYVEEVDLQKRLAGRGLRTFLQRSVGLAHLGPNASRDPSPIIRRYAARGLLRYFAKHGTPAHLLACRLLTLASLRLPPKEALAPKQKILTTPTGP